MNSKSIKKLNVRNKSQTFREENMKIHLCGRREKICIFMKHKAKFIKDKPCCIKLKTFVRQKRSEIKQYVRLHCNPFNR